MLFRSTPARPNRAALNAPAAFADRQLVGGAAQPPASRTVRAETREPAPASAAARADQFVPRRRQDRYRLEIDLVASRIYVLDKRTGEPVDRYLTSPGTASHPTMGDHFTIRNAQAKAAWHPPASPWAKNAQVVPGGENNPMGIFKMSLGGYEEYIHGTPADERQYLGRPASHGCLRMSNENVLQLFERYAGVGTRVDLNRDPAVSRRLQAAFEARGLKDDAITDGAELLPGAIAGRAPTPSDQ